ncbi:MAG: hypothetical protein HY282_02755 [Nitrospirae bacterium]|nr:hypothetical protein [Candidatus Manganitrophaceae bacterium]
MLRSYLKFRLKALLRLLGEEWPTYFLLGPVMVGAVFLLGRRIFHDFASSVGKIAPSSISNETMLQLALAALFLKMFFNFLPLSKRIYPTESSLGIDDLLPIRSEVRYQMFYIDQLVRDFPFFLIAFFVVLFFGRTDLIAWVVTFWLFFPGIEVGLTLFWNHLKPPSQSELVLAFFILLWLIWFLPVETMGWWVDFIAPFLVTIGVWGFGRWRYKDVAAVEALLLESQPTGRPFPGVRFLLPETVRPLVVRDFILTLRNFAPLFWRNVALALILLLTVAFRGSVSVAVLCAAAVYFLASTASTLFALQRPYRGIDYALPLPVERIWRGKILYAIFISAPVPLLAWLIEMAMRPQPPGAGLRLLVELVLIGLAVAALTGGTICEGDQKPALHAIVAGFLSVLATLFISAFHPLLFVLVFPVLGYLRGSAITRLENEEAA